MRRQATGKESGDQSTQPIMPLGRPNSSFSFAFEQGYIKTSWVIQICGLVIQETLGQAHEAGK